MNSVKTGVVVVVLLGVLYGVYKVLNVPEKPLTPEEKEAIKLAENLSIETGTPFNPSSDPMGLDASQGSPVAVPAYDQTGVSPADPSSGSTSRVSDFVVPPLADNHDAGGSDNRNQYTQVGPDAAPARGASPAADQYVAAGPGSNAIGRDLPPLEPSPKQDNSSGSSASYYGSKADVDAAPDNQLRGGATEANRNDIAARSFDRAMRNAEDLVAAGNYRDALAELTTFYDAPSLTSEEQQRLVNWLDPLAGKVIYSSDHQLEPPRIVRSGETLSDIAYEYGVPESLLYNINRSKINNPRVLRPGTELKVVRGPFEARVSLGKGKLTLFLGELYAGHFPITAGRDPIPHPGNYYVKQLAQGREYVAVDGRPIPAESPDNPYGNWWIDLGSEMSIHGSAANGNADGRGCMSLSAVDIGDLAGILSRDSKVRIEE